MRLANLTWPQAEKVLAQDPVVIFPIGTAEQHGRHLPLGTDMIAPEYIADRIEAVEPDVLILPSWSYGQCDSQTEFPGTISLGPQLLYEVIYKVFSGLMKHGVRSLVELNGHGGNNPVLDQVALDLRRQGCMLAEMNWWLMAWDLNPAWKGGHGGAEETAGVLAVNPTLVDWDSIEDMTLKPVSDEMEATGFKTVRFKGVEIPLVRPITEVTDNGWIGPDHPKNATEAWGRDMLKACAEYIADFMGAFRRVPLPDRK